ncbi:hypothetical protein [Flavicella marina]|uniref:hypothetical protein n=1 Tax=Flavicella marina TaxID=1475951 RepID=UPI001264D133|nr:hypothetical protein [Flavicella marina]
MKILLNKIALTILTLTLVMTSCAEQNVSDELQDVQMGTVDFSIQESTINSQASKKGSKLAAKTNELADVTKAIITILTEDGSPTDFDNTELTVNRLNGELLVQKIALPIGNYQLTQFSFMDVNNDIIFTTPLAGSELADLVTNPLAIDFIVDNNAATPVDVEVVSTETYTPQDFGLVSFPITEVEKLDFLLAVSELGGNEILAGEYFIFTDGFTTAKNFTTIEENVVTVRDIPDAVYELHISVENYDEYQIDLTRDDIANNYHETPLIVELIKAESCYLFTDTALGASPLYMGTAGQIITLDETLMVNSGFASIRANTSAISNAYIYLVDENGVQVGFINGVPNNYGTAADIAITLHEGFEFPIEVASYQVYSWWNSASMLELSLCGYKK